MRLLKLCPISQCPNNCFPCGVPRMKGWAKWRRTPIVLLLRNCLPSLFAFQWILCVRAGVPGSSLGFRGTELCRAGLYRAPVSVSWSLGMERGLVSVWMVRESRGAATSSVPRQNQDSLGRIFTVLKALHHFLWTASWIKCDSCQIFRKWEEQKLYVLAPIFCYCHYVKCTKTTQSRDTWILGKSLGKFTWRIYNKFEYLNE